MALHNAARRVANECARSLRSAPLRSFAHHYRPGLSLSLTEATAPAGREVQAGLEIWRDHLNARGGLLGRPIELVYYDDQASPANTVIGPMSFGADGEWKTPRIIYAQFQNVSGNDIGQFKDMSRQIVVWPPELKTGNLVYPYSQASR